MFQTYVFHVFVFESALIFCHIPLELVDISNTKKFNAEVSQDLPVAVAYSQQTRQLSSQPPKPAKYSFKIKNVLEMRF